MSKPRGDRFGGVIFDIQQHRKGEPVVIPSDALRGVQREKLIHVISTLITMVEEIDDLEFTNPRIGVGMSAQEIASEVNPWFQVRYCYHCGKHLGRKGPRDCPACMSLPPIEEPPSNPRIGYECCKNTEHDRFGQRKTDCTECHPPPRAFGGGVGGCPCGCGRTAGFCLYGRTFPEKEQASLSTSLADLTQVNTDIRLQTLEDREPPRVAAICACEAPLCNADATYPKACYSCGGIVVAK